MHPKQISNIQYNNYCYPVWNSHFFWYREPITNSEFKSDPIHESDPDPVAVSISNDEFVEITDLERDPNSLADANAVSNTVADANADTEHFSVSHVECLTNHFTKQIDFSDAVRVDNAELFADL